MIRPANENDIPAIVELIKESFGTVAAGVFDHNGKRAGVSRFFDHRGQASVFRTGTG